MTQEEHESLEIDYSFLKAEYLKLREISTKVDAEHKEEVNHLRSIIDETNRKLYKLEETNKSLNDWLQEKQKIINEQHEQMGKMYKRLKLYRDLVEALEHYDLLLDKVREAEKERI